MSPKYMFYYDLENVKSQKYLFYYDNQVGVPEREGVTRSGAANGKV